MKKYGYIINSDDADSFMENLQSLLNYGCDDLFIEANFLENEDKIELEKLLDKLELEDEVVIPSLAMFGDRLLAIQEFGGLLVIQESRLKILTKNLEQHYRSYLPNEVKLVSRQKKIQRSVSTSKRQFEPGIMGRPKIPQKKVDDIIAYRVQERLTYREISELTDLSLGTVYKYFKSYQVKK